MHYLIRLGLGESEDLWRVLVEAEHSLANIAAKNIRYRYFSARTD